LEKHLENSGVPGSGVGSVGKRTRDGYCWVPRLQGVRKVTDMICTGCGRLGAEPPPPPALSCCPERRPVPVDSEAGIETVKLFDEIRAERAAKESRQ
jgi:hypothetical protein